jgi:hypothetical protein
LATAVAGPGDPLLHHARIHKARVLEQAAIDRVVRQPNGAQQVEGLIRARATAAAAKAELAVVQERLATDTLRSELAAAQHAANVVHIGNEHRTRGAEWAAASAAAAGVNTAKAEVAAINMEHHDRGVAAHAAATVTRDRLERAEIEATLARAAAEDKLAARTEVEIQNARAEAEARIENEARLAARIETEARLAHEEKLAVARRLIPTPEEVFAAAAAHAAATTGIDADGHPDGGPIASATRAAAAVGAAEGAAAGAAVAGLTRALPPFSGRPRIDLLFAGGDPMADTAAEMAIGDRRARTVAAAALRDGPPPPGAGFYPPMPLDELMRRIPPPGADPRLAPPYPRIPPPTLPPGAIPGARPVLLDPRLDPIFQPGVPNPEFVAGKIAAEVAAETLVLRDAQTYAHHRRVEADDAAEAVFARGASRRVAELHRAEEKLAVMRDNAALRTEHTFLLLEEENARLADEKQRVELHLKELETELYDSRRSNEARGQEQAAILRAEQKEGKAKDALIARLSSELEQAQTLAKASEATAREVKGKHEEGEDEQAEQREKLLAAERRITQLESDKVNHEETISKQESKLGVAKGASVRRESLSEGVMEVLYRVQNCVEHCQKFTKDCAAQGYFASRSKELLLEANSVFESLVDVASLVDKKKSRGSVIEKLEMAKSGKQKFKGAGLALIAKARMGGLLGAAKKAAATSANP